MTLYPEHLNEITATLRDAENALMDYIERIEKTGATLGYGHSVLERIRRSLGMMLPTEPNRLKSFLMSFTPDMPLRLPKVMYDAMKANTKLLDDPQFAERVVCVED